MNHTAATETAPNHRGGCPGFSGIGGLVAALTMAVRRAGDAELAIELGQVRPGDRVVDIGCGPGAAVRAAAKTGAAAVGVEPAPVMLRVARTLTRSNGLATFVAGSAEAIPLSDGHANVAWSLASVHHWPDLDAGLAEVHRILSAGGRFVVMERRTRPGATGHASHGWTDEQLVTFAERCSQSGFEDVRTEHRQAGRRSLQCIVAVRR